MKCEIDIDLGPLADEWEPVAFRIPISSDSWIGLGGGVCSGPLVDQRLIVRRRWKWPEWLTAEWYCEDSHGASYGCTDEPKDVGSCWFNSGRSVVLDGIVGMQKIGGDWRQSKRRNPNAKATT